MNIIPAIDLLEGKGVRLVRGDYGKATEYCSDPAETAAAFFESGAEILHVVDLDAARGSGNNFPVLEKIRRAFPGTLQAGGGIRTEESVEKLISLGVNRLILGTLFIREPEIAGNWAKRYGAKFWASLDIQAGRARVSGWESGSPLTAEMAAALARDTGMAGIIYTDIERDGMLCGADFEGAERIAAVSGLPVILSGGVSSMEDVITASERTAKGITGLIIGKAIYTGAVDLRAALEAVRSGEGNE